ncbi:hypothetical protein TCE0_033r09724 [Talaromyces pinophilus]|uniref:C2H2-type domain-containing protein n=1 Tax=Talaromyces pinophilus TaxID=128442 RepID=A0A6V8HK87_TALPI|nr:hypothetical protein TCE0_033r09724 [Talaromyces pinophilus]
MDHRFASSMPFNSIDSLNNDLDQSFHIDTVPTMPYKGLHSTQSFDIMPALSNSISHSGPVHPISTYNYTSVPAGTKQGPASVPQVALLDNSTIAPFQHNGYHHHLQEALMPSSGHLYDKHCYQDEGWMQFAFSAIDSKLNDVHNNENNSLQSSDQYNVSPPIEATPSKKCEWKGCTFPRPFRRDAELMRHIKTIHIARDAYKCPVCRKGFGRKDRMEDHRRTHTHNHALGGKTLVSQNTRQAVRELDVPYLRS